MKVLAIGSPPSRALSYAPHLRAPTVAATAAPTAVSFQPTHTKRHAPHISSNIIRAARPARVQAWESDDGTVSLQTPPDDYQGFGRVALNTSLPTEIYGPFGSFADDDGNKSFAGRALFVDDNATLGSGQERHYSWATFDSTVPLSITLSWYDPPNVVAAAKQLLHDLNLRVYDAAQDRVYYPNGLDEPDEVNTVEKVGGAVVRWCGGAVVQYGTGLRICGQGGRDRRPY